MAITDEAWMADFILDNLLLLDEYMKADKVRADEWFPGQGLWPLQRQVLRAPHYRPRQLLYYNRDLFQRSGVSCAAGRANLALVDVLARRSA